MEGRYSTAELQMRWSIDQTIHIGHVLYDTILRFAASVTIGLENNVQMIAGLSAGKAIWEAHVPTYPYGQEADHQHWLLARDNDDYLGEVVDIVRCASWFQKHLAT